MSYEGETEYLCEEGHYDKYRATYGDVGHLRRCSVCRKVWAYRHDINHTNGFYSDQPGTFQAGKKVIDHTDIRQVDHYGNAYVIRIARYETAESIDSETGNNLGNVWEPYR